MAGITPRSGPCSPWISAEDVLQQPGCSAYPIEVCAEAASVASELLYKLSGAQFTGACGPVTVRPLCRPVDSDVSLWSYSYGSGIMATGLCSGIGTPNAGIANHYCSRPREVDLGAYPVIEVEQVLIDGVVIPAAEYQLQDYRWLVRMLPTASSTPTERWGWPTSQRLDLPDTQPATFSVTYRYGSVPPDSGLRAAKALGAQFAKAFSGDSNQLPVRTTSVSRQGVSSATVDVEDIVAKGLTGIYQVDLFIQAYNPNRNTRRARVWSPDTPRSRRMPQGTT